MMSFEQQKDFKLCEIETFVMPDNQLKVLSLKTTQDYSKLGNNISNK